MSSPADFLKWSKVFIGRVVKSVNGEVPDEAGNIVVTGGPEVIDNLNSTAPDAALSANQGRTLGGLLNMVVLPGLSTAQDDAAAALAAANAAVKSVNGQAPDGSGNVVVEGGGSGAPATGTGTTLVLDTGFRQYDPLTVTGPLTLTLTGDTLGATAAKTIVADGVNMPEVVGGTEWGGTAAFWNEAGIANVIQAYHNGVSRTFQWSREKNLNPVEPEPPADVIPGAPTSFAAGTAGSTTQPLTWAAPATGYPASYTYSIAYRVNGSGAFPSPQLTGLTGTSTTVTGLTASTSYDYQITATNAAGTGPAATLTGRSTAAPPSGGEDAITTDYRARMSAAGRTVNETHVGYADTFAKGLRAAGLHTKPTLVVLAMGDAIADALIPFIGSTAQTAQGGVTFDPALGFSTDGTSGRVNTGLIGKAAAIDFWAYNRTAQASDATGRCLMGTSSTTDNYRIIGNRTPGIAAGSANGHASNLMGSNTAPVQYAGITSGGLTAGMWHTIRRSASNTELVRNGTSVSLNTTAVTAAGTDTTQPLTVMALNLTTGSPNSYLTAGSRVSSYGVGDGTMTISEMATLRTLVQAFETSMGRAV